MTNFIKTQTCFAHGEIAPEFYARDNIDGLSVLENMDVLSGGGLTRRKGLSKIAELKSDGRLISFSVGAGQDYILVMSDKMIYIYSNGKCVGILQSPWVLSDLDKIQYAQRFDTIIFVHPDYRPQVLQKTASTFELSDFNFAIRESDISSYMPFMKFEDSNGVNITISASDRGATFAKFTTNKDFWTPEHVSSRILMLDKQWIIREYVSPTEVHVYVNGTYTIPEKSISDWREQAFSNARGWPISITFHQDRLVFGGSRSYPGGIWMSKVGQHTNFDIGTGLDDEAIFLTLLSQQRQQICTVVSSDNLQILTTVGEWAISSKPLTPSSVDIKLHTTVGSCALRYLPPQKIEGKTIFISNSLRDIRELALDELGEKYNATDLCAFAKHMLISTPVDMAYNDNTKQLFVVLLSGNMAVLNQNSSLGIYAWGMYKTYGEFKSVVVIDDKTYVLVKRDDKYSLECFAATAMRDVDKYDFAWRASSVPLRSSNHNAKNIRVRKITARVLDTKSIFINDNRVSLPDSIYSADSTGYCGDVSVNLLGTMHDALSPYWTIHGNEPYPTTVLSITVFGRYSI